MKVFSTSLCCGLLTFLSVMSLLKSVYGRPHLSSGHELFPAKEHAAQEKLTQNLGFQRPFHADVDLPRKMEELRQLKKLREWVMEAKNTGLSNVLNNLSSSHTNKRACFWKYCV
ncbi:urotensin-2B [Mus pahari]|uniref:urotensin-2B n=1 Tax=Mus pahari TaxID=10093 RepID=UPI000A30EEFD|nr:urotensin-2B [Mus pahari]